MLGRWDIWTKSLDVDEPFSNDYTGNANALLDMLNRNTVEVEFPAATDITAQRKAATIGDEGACLFDSAADG